MAEQRHRVWLARLAIGSSLFLALSAIAVWVVWNQMTGEDSLTEIKFNGKDEATSPALRDEPKSEDKTAHALDPLLELARRALINHVQEHRDYTADLVKQERIGKTLYPPSTMAMKLRYNPNDSGEARKVSVYLKTTAPKSQAGREVLWIQDQNSNKLKAHESGLFGLVSVDLLPQSRLAMAGNRYPITEIGIERLLRKLIERGELDKSLGPAEVRIRENVELDQVPCKLLEVIHQEPFVEIDGKKIGFEFYLAQIYMDEERLVPIKYASFTWPKSADQEPELLESYTYENLKFNVGLTDADFDPENPEYRF